MSKPSSYAKNHAPQFPGAIDRPRLLKRLEAIRQYRLALLTAPAGYGKTTLAAQFARTADIPVAWHTIEERERDIPNLYEHSLKALEKVAPGIQNALPAPATYSPAELATLIAEHLWHTLTDDVVYVIDDVHHLSGFPAAEAWLQHMVSRLPQTCHLLLLSRTLPTLPFAELIARNEVLAIGQEDLRLTEAEIAELARNLLGDEPSAEEMQRLVHRLDGWPAGIMLALQPLPAGFGDGIFSAAPEPEALFESLASSMLEAQLPDLRHFLLESSVLTRLTPELCSVVLGIPNSAAWLNAAKTQNLFLTRVPGGLVYHTLFRDFLQKRLKQSDPERFVELHTRAARWFEEQDDIEQAFAHYIAAGRIDAAREIAEVAAGAYFAQGKFETLLAWNERLSQTQAEAPNLALVCATIYGDRCEYEAAQEELERARCGFQASGDEEGVSKARLQQARLHLQQGDDHRAIEDAEALLSAASIEMRGRALRVVGLARIRLGEVESGIEYLEQAVACYREAGLVSALSQLLQDLQFAYTRVGELEKAGACLQEVVALRRQLGSATGLAQALNNLGYYYHQHSNYRQALATLQEGLNAIASVSHRRIESYLLWSLGDLKRDLRDFDEAERHYARALSLVEPGSDPNLRASILISSAMMRRRLGRYDEAVLIAKEALTLANHHSAAFEAAMARAALWAARGHQGEVERAIDELELVIEELSELGARFELMAVLGVCASLSLLLEDRELATHYYQAAIDLALEVGTAQPLAVEVEVTPALESLPVQIPAGHPLPRALSYLRDASRALVSRPAAEADDEAPPSATFSLRVITLGREEVIRDGVPIPSTGWRAAAAREIFLYLLFAGPKTRGEISLVFWPDSSADQVRANFHTTLHRARQALGADVILYDKELYFINPDLDVWCDALQFERLARQANMLPAHDARAEDLRRKAVALYRGDFLPSLDAEWVYVRRDMLAELYLDTLIGLGRCAQARNDYRTAIATFHEALSVDPYREEIHREIMSCYGEMGERGRVLDHLRELRRLFRRELSAEPTEETLRFAQSLLS